MKNQKLELIKETSYFPRTSIFDHKIWLSRHLISGDTLGMKLGRQCPSVGNARQSGANQDSHGERMLSIYKLRKNIGSTHKLSAIVVGEEFYKRRNSFDHPLGYSGKRYHLNEPKFLVRNMKIPDGVRNSTSICIEKEGTTVSKPQGKPNPPAGRRIVEKANAVSVMEQIGRTLTFSYTERWPTSTWSNQ